jgi:Mg2+/Co2+ transporter CorC
MSKRVRVLGKNARTAISTVLVVVDEFGIVKPNFRTLISNVISDQLLIGRFEF